MRIFKYLPRRYAHGLLGHGLVRIGTLYDYKKQEHGRGITDGEEGLKEINVAIEHQAFAFGKDVPKTLAALGIIVADDSSLNITLEDIYVSKSFEAPNCFMWCASTIGSRSVMEQFDSADTCIEVTDPARFFSILDQSMMLLDAEFQGVVVVRYQPRVEGWNPNDLGLHPALIKGVEFSGQHEVRAIWTPTKVEDIGPITLHVEALAQCCELREI
jgi:hypothetical protein